MNNYSSGDLIDIALEYAETHKSFCTVFIDSLYESLEEYGELTDSQRDALERIVSKFRMIKS
jgi:hypothetical protein